MASREMPDQSTTHDAAVSDQATYRRSCSRAGVRDDRCYPALLPAVDKTPSVASYAGNSFVGEDVEKLYDFTAATTAATDAGRRGGAGPCPAALADYAPAVERAASTVDVGRTLTLFGADRLYQSATLACPMCVHHAGSTAWTREALYIERRPRRDHDVGCPLHVETTSVDVAQWQGQQQQQQGDVAMYPPGLRSPSDTLTAADNCQRHEHHAPRCQ